MKGRFAILLDGAFVTKRLSRVLGRFPEPAEILAVPGRIRKHRDLEGRELLRIFYYDAPPATGRLRNPVDGSVLDLDTTEVQGRAWRVLDALELAPDVALRKGEVAVRGWEIHKETLAEVARAGRRLQAGDLVPDIKQKGVDLRIGLDIARLSLLRLVDTIVVVTGDSDMIPAFKFARREGVRVYLDHLGGPVKRDLKAHADVVL